MKKLIYSFLAITVLVTGSLFVGHYDVARAYTSAVFSWFTAANKACNPSSTATTTKQAMTPGTGTTTVILCPDSNDRIALDIIFQASSTNSVLAIAFQANAGNGDWFNIDVRALDPATTTSGLIPNGVNFLTWTYASSSYANNGLLFNNSITSFTSINSTSSQARHIEFNAPVAKQTRAVLFMIGGSANANVWAGPSVKQNSQ